MHNWAKQGVSWAPGAPKTEICQVRVYALLTYNLIADESYPFFAFSSVTDFLHQAAAAVHEQGRPSE